MSNGNVSAVIDVVKAGFEAISDVVYASAGGGKSATVGVTPGKTTVIEFLEEAGVKPSNKMSYVTDAGVTLGLNDVIPPGTTAVVGSTATDNG